MASAMASLGRTSYKLARHGARHVAGGVRRGLSTQQWRQRQRLHNGRGSLSSANADTRSISTSASSFLASDAESGHAATGSSGAPLPTNAEVVVIGGGVIGNSMLYHLADAGVTDAILVEKTELTAGSTWHAAGLVTYFNSGANARNFHYDSLKLYAELEKETGLSTSFHEVGSIRMIDSPVRMEEALHHQSMSELWPAEQRIIGPDEIAELHPLVDTTGLLGGIYNTGDGHIDPTSVTNVLAAAARSRGAKIFRHNPVEGLTQLPDGRWEVHTVKGTVTANRIINCGGLWGKEIGAMAGVDLPLCHIEHQYVITGPISEVEALPETHNMKELPVLRDLYGSYYLRQERNGVLIGPYEPQDQMKIRRGWQKTGMPNDFDMELFEGDLERIMPHMEIALERVPCAVNGGIKDIINGPVSWAPDGQPMIGPQQGKKNLWNAVGFSYGIAHGGGAGKYLVHWMLNNEPPYELTEFDPVRYGEWATPAFTAAKVKESYGWNNYIVTPDLERPAGRPVNTTPIYADLKAAGCHFSFHNGWEVPAWFDHAPDSGLEPRGEAPSFRRTTWHEAVAEEVGHVLESAGIIDISAFSKFNVSGPGAEAFLLNLCANKMPALGRTTIVHMLTPSGKMLAELTISRVDEDTFYVVTGSEMERHDLRWFEQHLPEDGSVTIENVTKSTAVLGLCGPNSREIMQRLTDVDMSHEAFKFLDCRHNMAVGPARMTAIRISFTGELGWELHMPLAATKPVYDAIRSAGADLGGVHNFGGYALNSFRLEKGFRLLGSDMTKDHSALETGMVPRFIRLKAHDYVGRQALIDLKASGGVENLFANMSVEAHDADCIGNEPIYTVGSTDVIGYTTSGGYGHATQQSLAFGYLKKELAVAGTELEVDILGTRRPLRVMDGPAAETEPMRTRKAAQG